MTKKAVLLVNTNPVKEREAEYHEWYDTVHIPQILEHVPGVVGARRYERLVSEGEPDPVHRFLAVYDIEADDPAGVLVALGKGVEAGVIERSDVLDSTNPTTLDLYVLPDAT